MRRWRLPAAVLGAAIAAWLQGRWILFESEQGTWLELPPLISPGAPHVLSCILVFAAGLGAFHAGVPRLLRACLFGLIAAWFFFEFSYFWSRPYPISPVSFCLVLRPWTQILPLSGGIFVVSATLYLAVTPVPGDRGVPYGTRS